VAVEAKEFRFLPGVAPRLGWYVYALRDPLNDNRIFYVGKGLGDRVHQHAKAASGGWQAGESRRELKLATIQEIQAARKQVGVEIIRHDLGSSEEAYEVEAAVIDALRLAGHTWLTNLQRGHGTEHGWRPLADLVASYAAKPAEITEPVLLIKIEQVWNRTPNMDDDALYAAVKQEWRLGPRRNRAEYAFAVARGIIRGCYVIDEWYPAPHVAGRVGFNGRRSPDMDEKYRLTRIDHLMKRGQQSPVLYVNC
jgi:uncharacterized protein